MADEAVQGAGAKVVATWRMPLETTALILLGAVGVSIVGGIVNAVFTPGASAWRKLTFLGFNVVSIWHVAVLVIVVGLVLALRVPFAPDARGAGTARIVLFGSVAAAGVVVLLALIASIGALGDNDAFGGLAWPEKIGNIMQWLGGAAVAAAAALLALRALTTLLPAAPARPAPRTAPAAAPPAAARTTATAPVAPSAPPTAPPVAPGWAADPYGRHQWRYWDGGRWTDQVADGSTQSTDPAR
ncbi:MAG TPA: DUF2510 domain-containing protein [Acidimicrobiia bacterium]|nr:DUF2510 domain-containing protein [Acidimicrobiia bacterium]